MITSIFEWFFIKIVTISNHKITWKYSDSGRNNKKPKYSFHYKKVKSIDWLKYNLHSYLKSSLVSKDKHSLHLHKNIKNRTKVKIIINPNKIQKYQNICFQSQSIISSNFNEIFNICKQKKIEIKNVI